MQLPLKHSVPAVQTAPLAFRSVQAFDMQVNPAAQSASPLHIVRQVGEPHAKGEQLAVGCTQVPLPLQLPTPVKVEPLQLAVPQLVLAGAFLHAPLPSHLPVNPQGGLAWQPPCGSISSAPTGWHVPASPATLHDWQLPQLSDVQQTPSAQWPLSHSVGRVQIWPRRLRPHDPALQKLPGAQ